MLSSTCPINILTLLLATISTNLLCFVTPAQALGIKCRGSALCPNGGLEFPYLYTLVEIAKGMNCKPRSGFDCGPINDTDIWAPRAHIICLPQQARLGGICVFTQGNVAPLGTTGDVIRRKLIQLKHHGCRVCGSVPLSDNNDPDMAGILTVNWVSDSNVCWGLYPSTQYYTEQTPTNRTLLLKSNSNGRIVLPSVINRVETS